MKIVFYIIVILLLGVIIKNLATAILDNAQGKSIITSYKSTLTEKKKEHTFLKEQLAYVKSNSFVESEARNKLGLVLGGEVVVIAPQPEVSHKTATVLTTTPNWKLWLSLIQ